jgi:hypothetical protein
MKWLRTEHGIGSPVVSPLPWDTNCCYVVRVIHWLCFTRRWILEQDWYVELFTGDIIRIPKGFVFDGASIPKLFRFALSPTGILFFPAILHDYAYKYNKLIGIRQGKAGEKVFYDFAPETGKLYWDYLFRKVGIQVCKLYVIPSITWLALVCFGWLAWWKHRMNRRNIHK